MNKFIFSGVIRDVQAFGSKAVKLYKYQVETIRTQKNPTTKKNEEFTEIFYVKHWTKKAGALSVDFVGHFVGQVEYKKITSRKAVLKDSTEPFVYGSFDFTLNHFEETNKGLTEWAEDTYSKWQYKEINEDECEEESDDE